MGILVDKDGIGRAVAIGIDPLALPFIFGLRNHNTVGGYRPGILHLGNVDTLGLGFRTTLGPSAPEQIELSLDIDDIGMETVVPLVVGLQHTLENEITSHRVVGLTLQNIQLVIVGIAVIGFEIKIPMVLEPLQLGRPYM